MKKSALLTLLCASVLVNFPASAATQETAVVTPALPVNPAAAQNKPGAAVNLPDEKAMENLLRSIAAWRVYEPIAQEMLTPYALKPVSKESLKRLANFQFSETTQANFKEMFGNPDPLHVNVNLNEAGGQDLHFLLQALDYTDPQSNNRSRWDTLSGTVSYSKDLKHFTSVSDWPYFSQSFGTDMTLEMKQIRIVQAASYNLHHLALGTANIDIPEIKFDAGNDNKRVLVKNFRTSSEITQQGKMLNLTLGMNASEVQTAGRTTGPAHMEFRFLNLNESAFAEFMKEAIQLNKSEPSMEKRLAASNKLMKGKFLPMLTPTSRFEVSDMSVVYQSMKASLNGAVWFENARQSDMGDLKILKQKFASHFELSMPKALALKITRFIGAIQSDKNAEQQANAGLQGLIAGGMIKEEQDQLSVTFDFMNGVVKVNGHDMNRAAKK
ncbi:DUF945 family protein [Undibacterium sp. SXout11W]|uniref:DUF945 family protein n=1 Tax=Undibacterium sp. SXout11W TaxID=3413050 RepID=UPI003BF23738